MHWMTRCRRLAAVCALLPLLILSAQANGCLTRDALGQWLARNAPQAKVSVLAGEEARLFLAALNARPPQTAYRADEIVVVDDPEDRNAARVGLFRDGCLVQAGRMPRAMLRSLFQDIERGRA
jgi:hypothetical protein